MMNTSLARRRVIGLVIAIAVAVGGWPVAAQSGSQAMLLTIDGPLTPAFTTYLERGVLRAERSGAALVILRLNTPGGQIDLMEDMIAVIRNSRVPVVVFVAPRGATAGSAGTVITLAGHAAAMAPETAIGAASPVGGQGENIESTLEAKVKEILKAKVRTLAAHRPAEAIALAEATIEEAKAATANEAFEVGLVDLIANDVPDLLRQLDGFTVDVGGQRLTLETEGLVVTEVPLNLLEAVLNLLTNPNVVFLLLALGAQAILIELSSPGGWVAGFIGVVALALAFYGLGVLPVNWFGLTFIILAFVLFLLEINATSHGALATAGTASLIVGALILFNSPGSPDFFRVSVPLVIGTSLVLAAGFVVILTFALRAQRRPVAVGVESLIGQEGEARSENSVQVAGELWSAEPVEGLLEAGQKVEVTGVKGLRLQVRRKKP
jgi:membrane-bound serine protease (ClpP class)